MHEPTPAASRTVAVPASKLSAGYADMPRCQICGDPAASTEGPLGQVKQQHTWPGRVGVAAWPYDHNALFDDPSKPPAPPWPVAMIAQHDGRDPLAAELWEDPTLDTVVKVVYCHTRRSARIAVTRILGPAGCTQATEEQARTGQIVLVDQYGGGPPPRQATIVHDSPTSNVVQVKYLDNGRTAGVARGRIRDAGEPPSSPSADTDPLAAINAKPTKNSLTGHGNPATGIYFGTEPTPTTRGRRVRLSRPSMAVLIADADTKERIQQFGTTRKFWLAPDVAISTQETAGFPPSSEPPVRIGGGNTSKGTVPSVRSTVNAGAGDLAC